MAKTKSGWLKGCGIGCGVAIVLSILLTVSGSIMMMKPIRDAASIRETLDERHGGVNDFTPWPDGGIPAERLEAFLRVRRAVQDHCAKMAATDAGIEAMDRIDDQEKPDTREILGAFGEISKSVLGLPLVMGRLYHARNTALLEVDMSLGEYTYIYVLAYGPMIVGTERGEEDATGEAHLSARVRGTLRRQLGNRLAAMDERPEEWAETEERRLLVEEIAVLEDHPERLPWCNVRPPALQDSLAPYEERLAGLFCPDATRHELTRIQSSAFGIQGD
jgi:hypothetical protein